jgi:probable rRNA maturation factor
MKMPDHVINITIKRSLHFPYKRPWLRSIITTVLRQENVAVPTETGCVITDDDNIRKYNSRYRGIDKPTDVLSFPMTGKPLRGDMIEFPPVPGAPCNLGDIVISFPRATAQAGELGHKVEDELALLLVHGTLHLLNYDHKTSSEAKKMQKREKAIIKILGELEGQK